MSDRPVESWVEQKVVEYATLRGMLTLKLNVKGRIGWPDRIFMFKGKVFFVEFKREGEKPRKAQEYVHKIIRDQEVSVYVVDDVNKGKELIDVEYRRS